MKTRNTNITYTTDDDGTEIAHVAVRNDFATIENDDLVELERQGVSLNWYLKVANGNGYVCACNSAYLGKNMTIARLVTGAGNGDRLNLRQSNLYIGEFPNATGPTPKGGSLLVETHEGLYNNA